MSRYINRLADLFLRFLFNDYKPNSLAAEECQSPLLRDRPREASM